MGFYKDFGGFIAYLLCIGTLIFQFFFIYNISDEDKNSFLSIHKIINYVFLFLAVYSHLKTSIIDPGEITALNNKDIIEFYYNIHEILIKNALYIIEKRTPEVVKQIILGDVKEKKPNNENDEDELSEKDEYTFEPKTSVNDELKNKISKDYYLKLSRCSNCYVVRPINAHHCCVCHKCYLEQDHHCPWVNNCIGMFNRKIFILFLSYSFIEVIYSDFLFFYYSLFKDITQFNSKIGILIFDIFAMIFGLILAIASVLLLYQQYDMIHSDCTQCDYKKGILLEKSTVRQQLKLIFGNTYSFKWFLPFFSGGNYDIYKQIKIYLKILKEKQNKNNNDNIEKKKQRMHKSKKD